MNPYKAALAQGYDRRSEHYDQSQWHWQICQSLLAFSQLQAGQRILDIGTGTGHLALKAAQLVGASGWVIGIDISEGMLRQARRKAQAMGNLTFALMEAEKLTFPDSSFDRILCANAFPWMEDKPATLQLWHRLLVPGGLLGIHTPAETAYVGQVLAAKVLKDFGIELGPSNRSGTLAQLQQMLQQAGFLNFAVKTEQHGKYISIQQAKASWQGVVGGAFKDAFSSLSAGQLAQAQAQFESELQPLLTAEGIWDDLTTWYITAHKAGQE